MERIREQLRNFLARSPCAHTQKRELGFKWLLLNYIQPFFKSTSNVQGVRDFEMKVERRDSITRVNFGKVTEKGVYEFANFVINEGTDRELRVHPITASMVKGTMKEMTVIRQVHRLFIICMHILSQESG